MKSPMHNLIVEPPQHQRDSNSSLCRYCTADKWSWSA